MSPKAIFDLIESKYLTAIKDTYELADLQSCYNSFIAETNRLNKETGGNFSMTSTIKVALHNQRKGILSGEIKKPVVKQVVEEAKRPTINFPKVYPVIMTRINSSGSVARASDKRSFINLLNDGWSYDVEGTCVASLNVH